MTSARKFQFSLPFFAHTQKFKALLSAQKCSFAKIITFKEF